MSGMEFRALTMKLCGPRCKPFYAYIPFSLVHMPVLPHPDFVGKTGNGDWADCLAEMDYPWRAIRRARHPSHELLSQQQRILKEAAHRDFRERRRALAHGCAPPRASLTVVSSAVISLSGARRRRVVEIIDQWIALDLARAALDAERFEDPAQVRDDPRIDLRICRLPLGHVRFLPSTVISKVAQRLQRESSASDMMSTPPPYQHLIAELEGPSFIFCTVERGQYPRRRARDTRPAADIPWLFPNKFTSAVKASQTLSKPHV